MKKILSVLGVLVVLVAIAIGVVLYYAGDIVQQAIERVGSRVTQVEVTLNEVDLDRVTDGAVALRGLRVGNPGVFKSDYAFDLGEIGTSIDYASVRTDVIVIREIVIDGPKVIYEYREGASNIGTIQQNVNAFIERVGGAGEGQADETESAAGGRKLIIENFHFRNARVDVRAPILERDVGSDIPAIHLRDIGKKQGGATPGEVAAIVLAEINRRVMRTVGGLDLGEISELANRLQQDARSAVDSAREGAVKQLEQKAQDATKDVKEKAKDKLKGLIE